MKHVLTISKESRAARATMSAHETTPGQLASNWDFASVMTPYPLTDWLGIAVCSVPDPVRSNDASHPWKFNRNPYLSLVPVLRFQACCSKISRSSSGSWKVPWIKFGSQITSIARWFWLLPRQSSRENASEWDWRRWFCQKTQLLEQYPLQWIQLCYKCRRRIPLAVLHWLQAGAKTLLQLVG